jgi:hypothetical protein
MLQSASKHAPAALVLAVGAGGSRLKFSGRVTVASCALLGEVVALLRAMV